MGGAISSLLDISQRSLANQSRAIQVIGNDIANVNTPGYSRREVEFVDKVSTDATSSAYGEGADIKDVVRDVDDFINSNLQAANSDQGKADVRNNLVNEAQSAFSLDQTQSHIGSSLTDFFSAVNDLEANPSDSALRSQLINSGQELTTSINLTYQNLAQIQREADGRIRSDVTDINTITGQIASLNQQIATGSTATQDNLGLEDQRDQLLQTLSTKVSFKTVTDNSGSTSVYLANGFALVNGGESKTLSVTDTPPTGSYPPGLDGSALGSVVWNSDPSNPAANVDLTGMLAAGSGEVSGLLQTRGVQSASDTTPFDAVGDIPDLASRVEAISQTLLTTFNQTYLNNGNGTADPSGNSPASPFALFGLSSGPIATVGTYPTAADLAASGVQNFSSLITFVPTDPTTIALAKNQTTPPAVPVYSSGDGQIASDLSALESATNPITVGHYSTNDTLENIYSTTVTQAGSVKNQAQADLDVANNKQTQMTELQTSTSGVSLDEELSKLITYQTNYQASAHMIKAGDDLFSQLLNAVGG